MRQPPSNICPLKTGPCIEDWCAWWNHPGCIMSGVVEELGNIAACLDDIARTQKELPGATNAEQLKVEKAMESSDSTSTINENGGFVK